MQTLGQDVLLLGFTPGARLIEIAPANITTDVSLSANRTMLRVLAAINTLLDVS